MKRIGNLYEKICSLENLEMADEIARKGKKRQYGIVQHDKDRTSNLLALRAILLNKTYKTSAYTTFSVFEPKERLVFRLPYYPDRITHHAMMNILEPIFKSLFTADTYACIKGRGIHAASFAVRKGLKDVAGTHYCLKIDIKKFYPNVDHDVLKGILRRKFKDNDLLWLLDEIIDSAEGIPIGNYLSQYFSNLYLTSFDHWIKEVKGVKHYYRYADDMVILSDSKQHLHQLLAAIRTYLFEYLHLLVKDNYQVFPVASLGIDFVGYVHYHTHTLLRKGIKKNFARMLAKKPRTASIASYKGWAKHCNSHNLIKKLHIDETVQRVRNKDRAPSIPRRQDKD